MSKRVVLVEDEELIRTMVQLNLEQEGFLVTSYTTAEQLLDLARKAPACCDLILLDIMLPGMHGDAALMELRKLGSRVPVLMLTAKQEVSSRVQALNAGADDYLPKPFDVEELIARVNALLRRAPGQVDNKEVS